MSFAGLSSRARPTRRRPRARGRYSDDEIEREAPSDTDSASSGSASSSLDSDSETEPASEDAPPGLLAGSSTSALLAGPSTAWADMVADAAAEDLPVIDFADLAAPAVKQPPAAARPVRARRAKHATAAPELSRTVSAPAATRSPAPVPAPEPEPEPAVTDTDTAPAPTLEPAHEHEPESEHEHEPARAWRRPGQTARQAYQERLERDPAFVPRVGGFWGHDDRLLDKDLRALSGWWRGRWQFRGRGRGAPHAFANGRGMAPQELVNGHAHAQDDGTPEDAISPSERPWTHDGFEEMRRRDELRRGRGGFFGRGRGRGRGGFSPRARPEFTTTTGTGTGTMTATSRVWYAHKPERVWTKHHEGFLYSDAALKPRAGVGPGFRIKLSGGQPAAVVRTPGALRAMVSASAHAHVEVEAQRAAEAPVTVRMPVSAPAMVEEVEDVPESVTTKEEPVGDAFAVHTPPITIVSEPAPAPVTASVPAPSPAFVPTPAPVFVPTPKPASLPALNTRYADAPRIIREKPPHIVSPPADSVLWNPTVAPPPPPPSDSYHTQTPLQSQAESQLPVFQTQAETLQPSFQPPLQSQPELPIQTQPDPSTVPPPQLYAPSYAPSYAYAPPQLPPGIALSQHGYPYEIATGRAVYLPPPPPPPGLYAPPPPPPMSAPGMNGMSGHPGMNGMNGYPSASMSTHQGIAPMLPFAPHHHARHPSVVSLAGSPIFAPPRQSSRIEIRRPDGAPASPPFGANGKDARSGVLGVETAVGDETGQAQMQGEERAGTVYYHQPPPPQPQQAGYFYGAEGYYGAYAVQILAPALALIGDVTGGSVGSRVRRHTGQDAHGYEDRFLDVDALRAERLNRNLRRSIPRLAEGPAGAAGARNDAVD
ncbi:hypothetical protein K488DRAFT_71830 [Vararia minispora EC-137]|uniref:Uncharacterized protein n=1 Tax=Vararia minispora EC-137 TaxID=1314806 RepID=A0ACB8QGL3_9AGAM|nr:hypothetical protein K488DRAFT_71830 [Vararia minispora EC-137]